ncbi:hypothetical protein ID866_11105 [Astraeus odoratus]|nr:hypothetical protein ID866_11105 [Astraeus odoratus]
MLHQKVPILENIPVWGCRVKVHDTTGSKLDMRAKDGHWVGFDPESDGHHIYWPGSQSIGVERSVIFEQHDITVQTDSVSLEGGKPTSS